MTAKRPDGPAAMAVRSRPGALLDTATAELANFSNLAYSSRTVHEIAEALEVPRSEAAHFEAADHVEFHSITSLATARRWQMAEWFRTLNDDLTVQASCVASGCDGERLTISLDAHHAPVDAWDMFLHDLDGLEMQTGEAIHVEVRVHIRKERPLALARALIRTEAENGKRRATAHTCTVRFFYFAAAFDHMLKPDVIAYWEQSGFMHQHASTLIVLGDRSGYLGGPLLEVVGAVRAEPPMWLHMSDFARMKTHERVREMCAQRDHESVWNVQAGSVTPPHFAIARKEPGLDTTASRLNRLEAVVSALFLASFVRTTETGGFSLRFDGSHSVDCHIPRDSSDVFGSGSPASLTRLVNWSLTGTSGEKLAIAREALLHSITRDSKLTLEQMARGADSAYDAARANFRISIRRNTERYFQLRQQAFDTVSTFADSVRRSVTDLATEVVSDVYRTLGLSTGVVFASLFQPALATGVQRVAATLYVAYFLFVLLFVLRARRRRYELEVAALDSRLAELAELTPRERAAIRGQTSCEEAYFERYLKSTERIYGALALISVLWLLLTVSVTGQGA